MKTRHWNLLVIVMIALVVGILGFISTAEATPVPPQNIPPLPTFNAPKPPTNSSDSQQKPSGITNTFGAFELNRAEVSLFGEFPEDALGYFALSYIGDINNDTYDDFAVGAFIYDGSKTFGGSYWGKGNGCGGYDPGALYIVLGRPNSQITSTVRNASIRDIADVILVGDSADWFGRTFTSADLNADGKNDLIVAGGANSSTYWTSGTIAHGAAFIIWGRSLSNWNNWMTSITNSINSATYPSAYSCYNPTNHPYKVKSIYSAADASLLGEQADDRLGWTQMGSADVNGDGHWDLLTSAYTADTGTGINPYTKVGNGKVYVVFADSTKNWTMNMPISTTANAILKGDTVVGQVYTTTITGTQWITVGLSENIGGWLTGVGDVTGDDKEDFVVGPWRHMLGQWDKRGPLNAYLVSGATITNGLNQLINNVALTRFTADLTVYPGLKAGTLGWSSAKLGDINRDGSPDFSLDNPFVPQAAIGSVYVFYGRPITNPWPSNINLTDSIYHQCNWTSTTLAKPDILLQPRQSVVEFGNGIGPVGDIDGDSYADFVVTASAEPRYGADYPDYPPGSYWYSRGKAFLFFGATNLLNPCDNVYQSERNAGHLPSYFTNFRSTYRRLWSEETGLGSTAPGTDITNTQRGALIHMVSPIPGDFNGDGKNDILVADVNASARETCDTVNMITDPESVKCNLGKIYVLLGKSDLRDTAVPELWMRDTSLGDNPHTEDIGNEPNTQSTSVNASPDLWVRVDKASPFSISSSYSSDLNSNVLSTALRNEFLTHNITLSANATLENQYTNYLWWIRNPRDVLFIIQKNSTTGNLDVDVTRYNQQREHQPPTLAGQNVLVNARITNSGSEWDVNVPTITNTAQIYWTYSPSFTWPIDFTGTRGGLVGTIITPTIGPGDRKVFSLSWTVPITLPTGCTLNHISFLARFTSGVVETSNGWDNVRNNRRIVARAGTATTSCLSGNSGNNGNGGYFLPFIKK